ncbi:Ig-like domain-containing protein, partial [Enterobacter bugandensis]
LEGLSTSVTLETLVPVPANSGLNRSTDTIAANGATASTLTLTLKDANNRAVKGQSVQFVSDLAGSTVGAAKDNGDGTYTADLTGTSGGTAHITVKVGGSPFGSLNTSVTLTALPPSATSSELNPSPASIPPDGATASTLELTLKDVLGQTIKGQHVQFVSDLANTFIGSVTDHGDGTYTAKLTGSRAGTANITVKVDGNVLEGLGTSVTLKTP